MESLLFTKQSNGSYESDVFTSVNGSALQIIQEKPGQISIYANAQGLSSRIVAQICGQNEIFQLNLPSGLEMKVITEYESEGAIV